jgi:hemerythrin-like domain-containing protein
MWQKDRREFLVKCAAVSGALIVPATLITPSLADVPKAQQPEVSPTEDLMREHGVLNRVLLVYDECLRRLIAKELIGPKVIADSAELIRTFIEEYHEKIEEEHIFPRFRKAGKLVELVDTLQKQHAAGRRVTARIHQIAQGPLQSDDDRNQMCQELQAFIKMYRPHEAREDTVLFPALHEIVTRREFDAMGDQFEDIERKTFHGEGFEMARQKIEDIEKSLGIHDLAEFTPKE